jgi:hypothetical protein
MTYKKTSLSLLIFVILVFSVMSSADVVQESTTKMSFKGALGTAMKLLGASKPIHTATYYKGNLYRSDVMDKRGRLTDSQIIDLDREVIFNIQHKRKRYTEMTFDEMKAMMQAGAERVEKARESGDAPKGEWSFKVDIDRPGDTQNLAGYDTEKVILTLLIEGEVADENDPSQTYTAKMTVTSDLWLTKQIPAGAKEMQNFHQTFMKKLGFDLQSEGMAAVLEQIMAQNVQLADAIEKLEKEKGKLEGFPLLTNTVFQTEGEAPKSAEAEESEKSVRGVLRGLGRKVLKSKKKESGPTVLLETEIAVQKFEAAPVEADLFKVPEGFTKVKNK